MNNIIHFTLFGSDIAFVIMVVALFLSLFYSDYEESGVPAFTAVLIAVGLNYFWGTFPILSIISLRGVFIYLSVGFIFSIVRTYFKGKKLSTEEKDRFELKDHVFRWWLMFPICASTWIFGDLLKELFDLVYLKIGILYKKVFNA